jgi:glycerol-3-phosphate dehydrogenase
MLPMHENLATVTKREPNGDQRAKKAESPMGSLAEGSFRYQEEYSREDDDAFSCRTDLTTVRASNTRRVTVRENGL